MPDWSYHPLLRPAATLLPRDKVRPFVLKTLAAIARVPGGRALIHFLGQMDPPRTIGRDVLGMQVASPVGLGAKVDPQGVAVEAFAQFGFGVIEIQPTAAPLKLRRLPAGVALMARFVIDPGGVADLAELRKAVSELAPLIDAVCLEAKDDATRSKAEAVCRSAGITNVVSGAGIVRGSLSSPREITEALAAGASLVLVDEGFMAAGPALAKRANEALAGMTEIVRQPVGAWRQGWPFIALLGVGMTIAGLVVLAVGLTRVTLPYDESFLGLHHDAIAALNPQLLAFMKHDRVTLAGTMISLGILYGGLALGGMRRGLRWSRSAVLASGVVGFSSIFLFLGFHYVDPLHVALAVGLFPLFVVGMLLPFQTGWPRSDDLDNDRIWRAGLWGQLYFIALGAGLTVAGVVIAGVGVTAVFVWSDLQFLATSADALSRANSHLLPLIAHDRAGFGGALASDGIAVMLLALWGFRRGERWVWWTLLLAGAAGFFGAVYAHIAVGYLEFGHLFPVAVSGAVYLAGLALSAPYLLARSSESRRAQRAPATGAATWL